jgi:hypothetical protein
MAGQDPAAEAHRLILDSAVSGRRLMRAELRRVLEHVALSGFDPNAREQARGRLAGIVWQGRSLRGSDLLPPAEAHYLQHVVREQSWPAGTSLQEYVESIRRVILDDSSGVFTSQYQSTWQLGIVRRSGMLRGPTGHNWVLVEYRVATGHWVTAYQIAQQPQPQDPRRDLLRWLRRPR